MGDIVKNLFIDIIIHSGIMQVYQVQKYLTNILGGLILNRENTEFIYA